MNQMAKDSLPYALLKKLAETLDFKKTMEDFPGITSQDMQSLLLHCADTLKKEAALHVYVDGASRGNPGDAGIGVFITTEDGKVLKKIGRYIGKTTNNVAEYQALVAGLKEAKALGTESVKVFADSELMVKQIKGEYKVKSEVLKPLCRAALSALMEFGRYDIIHVNREKNREADKLANQAIDRHTSIKGRQG